MSVLQPFTSSSTTNLNIWQGEPWVFNSDKLTKGCKVSCDMFQNAGEVIQSSPFKREHREELPYFCKEKHWKKKSRWQRSVPRIYFRRILLTNILNLHHGCTKQLVFETKIGRKPLWLRLLALRSPPAVGQRNPIRTDAWMMQTRR